MFNFLQQLRQLQAQAMGINRRNIQLIYPHNRRRDFHLADDKITTKSVLNKAGIACAETYAIISSLADIPHTLEQLKVYKKIAIKPANGRGGGGIMILEQQAIGSGNWQKGGRPISLAQITKHLADILVGVYSLGSKDRVLVEYCIEPHPFFGEIYPAGVPDFRIILLKGEVIMSMLRVPTDRSDGKANLHQGGLGIGIDHQKGRLTEAYDGKSYYDHHPDNGNPINGRLIPLWEETVSLAIATAQAFPLEYLGIDIVLDAVLGPLIMEINVRPGLGIQLVNGQGLKQAVQSKFAIN
ncbi:MAG: sugar-transfer associated ATP-grasp domain-containing protein [Bacteroidota bacterium]